MTKEPDPVEFVNSYLNNKSKIPTKLNRNHHDESADYELGYSRFKIYCDCDDCSCKDGTFCNTWGCECCKDE
jgi:hypothetical protein